MEDLALQLGQIRVEPLYGLVVLCQAVSRGEIAPAQHLLGGRAPAVSLLRVKGQLTEPMLFRCQAQLALDERLHEQSEEVEREYRFGAAVVP